MSQFGMQMPGGIQKRKPTPNIYTGLLFVAVAVLGAACAIVYINGAKVAPGGQPWKMLEADAPTGGYKDVGTR
jgi:hypothetical protein